MKDLQYITHDLGARNDVKLIRLQMSMGGQGLAIFWCLVEMLWEADGYLSTDYEALAFSLRWAKPEEVKDVVEKYGLFEHDKNRFWSKSALERIEAKKGLIQAQREGGVKGAHRRWNKQPNDLPNGEPIGNPMLINKDINKDRKRDNINNTAPLTAADLFEIFFFENMKDPAGEVRRFTEYYEGRGWTYLDGTPVTDPERAARDWKPKLPGKRCDDEALRWYKAVWNAAKPRVANARTFFLDSITNLRRNDIKLSIVFRNQAAAYAVGGFIQENDLAGDYKIDYRIES